MLFPLPPILLTFLGTLGELHMFPDLVFVPSPSSNVSNSIVPLASSTFLFSLVPLSGLKPGTKANSDLGPRPSTPTRSDDALSPVPSDSAWPPPVIFVEAQREAIDGDLNQSWTHTREVLQQIALNRDGDDDGDGDLTNNGERSRTAPAGHPWIFVLLCNHTQGHQSGQNTSGVMPQLDLQSVETVARAILPTSFQIDSKVHLVTCNNQNGSIFEAYYIRKRLAVRPLNMEPMSSVSRRIDFMKEEIFTTHARNWTRSFNSSKEVRAVGGGSYLFLAYMASFLNFKVTILGSKDWYAMADRVFNQECDFGLSATGMLVSVTEKFRFMPTPTYTDKAFAYYSEGGNPDALRQSQAPLFTHLKPFQTGAWVVIGILAFLLFACHYVSVPGDELCDSLLVVLSSFTLKGISLGEAATSRESARLMALISSVSGFLVYAFYSAELISSLSTYEEPSYSLATLFREGYTFGIINNSYLRAAQNEQDFGDGDSIASKLYSRLNPEAGNVRDATTGFGYALSHQKFAFITEETGVYRTIETTPTLKAIMDEQKAKHDRYLCSYFHALPIPEYTVQQSPIARKGAPFVNHLNLARVRAYEAGIWRLLEVRRQSAETLYESVCPTVDWISFTFRDVLLPFYVLGVGLGFCGAWFAGEVLWTRPTRTKRELQQERVRGSIVF